MSQFWIPIKGVAVLAGVVMAASCTFGGLGDYEIESCDPNVARLEDDVCNQFNDETTCSPYQCDRSERRCIRAPRDDDRDGDPSVTCGGGDCDDQNANVSSKLVETCDGLDNNCNGIADDGVLAFTEPATVVPAEDAWEDVRIIVPLNRADEDVRLAVAVKPAASNDCVRGFDVSREGSDTGCTILASPPDALAAQPSIDLASGGTVVGWVRRSGCAAGVPVLSEAPSLVSGTASESLDLATCGAGAAHPSVAVAPADSSIALALWRAEPALRALTPDSADCSTRAPVSLEAVVVSMADSMTVVASTTLSKTLSTRPPAVIGLPATTPRFLVGAALPDGGAALFLVKDSFLPVPAAIPIPGLPNDPTGVVFGIGKLTETRATVGVAIESGCAPQKAYFAIATVNLETDAVSVTPAILFETAERTAFVSPAWSPERGEWLIAWIGRSIVAQRIAERDGALVALDSSPISLEATDRSPVTLGLLRSSATPTAWNINFLDGGAQPGITQTSFGCSGSQ
ncbi:uncharacterized protein SOCE26_051330 [Sorangium cellulosum]|uniref:Secreted protein n=1 Tax=Sorangium cellulosum TaxID=56 RepID=A0A2L0EWK4_SORCE|nr:putative metal-binding motif-containing protein [Sorangium cellulosum]AUX43681.1 uncharacterized protein SOCE26_051330 [Sorangium cellulosum]